MNGQTKLWLGIGAWVLATTSPTALLAETTSVPNAAPSLLADAGEGGEGGEGGEAGGVPASYALGSTDPKAWTYDARAEIAAYAAGAHAQYAKAAADARTLRAAVKALLADPTDATLAAARKAWVAARPAYLVTEAYRFYDGPIEAVEGEVNAWPMNEAFVDYTKDDPKSGLINDPSFTTIDATAIAARNQSTDEADVTTGWHAIEFLLWGQDLDANGPGARPARDFVAGTPATDKRRAYLEVVTDLLVADLDRVAAAWAPNQPNNYAATFLALPEREALGRAINGLAVLAGSELRAERIAVALDSGDQEDEQSCFSDTTKQDFVFDLKGIETIYYGRYPGGPAAGLDGLVRRLDPAQADRLDQRFTDARTKIAALGDPWDRVLAAPPGSPPRQAAEAAVQSLGALASELGATGATLGVLVQIPGM